MQIQADSRKIKRLYRCTKAKHVSVFAYNDSWRDAKIFEVQIRTERWMRLRNKVLRRIGVIKKVLAMMPKPKQKEIEDKLTWFRDFALYSESETNTSATDTWSYCRRMSLRPTYM